MDDLIVKLEKMIGPGYTSSSDNRSYLLALIESAIEEVRNARYPGGYMDDEVKEVQELIVRQRYKFNILRIAQYHYDKNGISGVTSYSEAGVKRSYEAGGTPSSYFEGIVPVATYC